MLTRKTEIGLYEGPSPIYVSFLFEKILPDEPSSATQMGDLLSPLFEEFIKGFPSKMWTIFDCTGEAFRSSPKISKRNRMLHL